MFLSQLSPPSPGAISNTDGQPRLASAGLMEGSPCRLRLRAITKSTIKRCPGAQGHVCPLDAFMHMQSQLGLAGEGLLCCHHLGHRNSPPVLECPPSQTLMAKPGLLSIKPGRGQAPSTHLASVASISPFVN